jgi:GxxExxY protein
MNENQLSYTIIGAALEIHKSVGPGLLESAYENALIFELQKAGLNVKNQVPLPFNYKGTHLEVGYRIDLMVNNKVIVEIKSVETLLPVHYSQLLTYLRLSGLKLGILINFNSSKLSDGIHRIVNNL